MIGMISKGNTLFIEGLKRYSKIVGVDRKNHVIYERTAINLSNDRFNYKRILKFTMT